MMSKTHIAVGVACGLAIAPTGSIESCVAAIVGGSVGGIMADCDITPSKAHKDALIGRLIVVALVFVCLAIDYGADYAGWLPSSLSASLSSVGFFAGLGPGQGICDYLLAHLGLPLVSGIALFVVLTFLGGHTDHRSFTHSLVAMAAFCFAAYLVCEPLLPFFTVGYASHLALDITNKQGIRLFWPHKAHLSLGWCTAKGKANAVVMAVGFAAAVLLLAWRLAPLMGISGLA